MTRKYGSLMSDGKSLQRVKTLKSLMQRSMLLLQLVAIPCDTVKVLKVALNYSYSRRFVCVNDEIRDRVSFRFNYSHRQFVEVVRRESFRNGNEIVGSVTSSIIWIPKQKFISTKNLRVNFLPHIATFLWKTLRFCVTNALEFFTLGQ